MDDGALAPSGRLGLKKAVGDFVKNYASRVELWKEAF